VEHKSVAIGTVESVSLTDHDQRVTATVRMAKSAAPLLSTHARFWVVRPRFSLTDLSSLQTLISGSYIAIDPGLPGGNPTHHFDGLSGPPGVTSDQPGSTFMLEASQLGWLHEGAPVFYQDMQVGELLGYEQTGLDKPIRMQVFIKAPYDSYVRSDTHFWNTSGLSMNMAPEGVHVAVESVQALLAGGISFADFGNAAQSPPPARAQVFTLYGSHDEAQNAGFHDNILYVAYFEQSVAGLQAGSPVLVYGLRVGTVTGTQLEPGSPLPRVRVTFDVQPERVFPPGHVPQDNPVQVTKHLVKLGMRSRIQTVNLLTGQDAIGLDIVPDAPPAEVTVEGKQIVWPSQKGGFQDLTDSLSSVVAKLNRLPLDRLGTNANDLLVSVRTLTTTANNDLLPLGEKLPLIARDLENTLHRADRLLASMQSGYGANSGVNQALLQVTAEASRTLQSVRALADDIDRHPAVLMWGRR
jgi:paraquat-inducible protein B